VGGVAVGGTGAGAIGGVGAIGGQGGADMVAAGEGGAGGGVGGIAGGAMAGMGGAGGEGGQGSGSGMGVASVAMLSFAVLTQSQGGKYSPKNIGAIWIETSSGEFVKTLEVWAERRARYLTRWNREAGASRVDAVSGATLRSHATHSVAWDLTDEAGNPVAPGDYKVIVEATDRDATGASHEVPFTLGEPMTLAAPDASAFSAMSLTLQ
jgi:hypothetical protein